MGQLACMPSLLMPAPGQFSEKEVLLRQRHRCDRLAGQDLAVRRHFESFGVHLNMGSSVIVNHVLLADSAGFDHCLHVLAQSVFGPDVQFSGTLGHESDRGVADRLWLSTIHRAHQHRLRSRDGGIRISHLCPCDLASLDNHLRLSSESGGMPQHNVGEFPGFQRSDFVGHAVGNGRVNGVFRHVALRPGVVIPRLGVLWESAPLAFHFVSCLPRASNDLSNPSHCLGIGGHYTESTHVVKNVFGSNGFPADARLCKSYILRDILIKVMAHHQHVQVFLNCIHRKRASWVCRARNHIR
mmetsp:Transcript_33709/g.62627  ORF Transcript_33709/g.62627 Transcript_33709/m.62627 type:complete len:298 (-) Transcript_33709:42-935(-)